MLSFLLLPRFPFPWTFPLLCLFLRGLACSNKPNSPSPWAIMKPRSRITKIICYRFLTATVPTRCCSMSGWPMYCGPNRLQTGYALPRV